MDPIKRQLLRAELVSNLFHLSKNLSSFSAELLELPHEYPVWVQGFDQVRDARFAAGRLYRSLVHTDEPSVHERPRKGNESEVLAGAIAVTEELIDLAEMINHQKTRIREIFKEMAGMRITVTEEGETLQKDLLSYALSQAGYSRLHKQQTYRHIPIIPFTPESISLCWAHTRKVAKLSKQQALHYLSERKEDRLEEIRFVEALPDNHTLALVEPHRRHIRSNMTYPAGLPEDVLARCKTQMQSSMPIIYPYHTAGRRKLRFSPLSEQVPEQSTRMKRKDLKLEEAPLFDGLKLYQYINRC